MGTKMYIISCRTVLCLSEAEDGVVSWWQVAFISWQLSYFLGSGRVFLFWSLFGVFAISTSKVLKFL